MAVTQVGDGADNSESGGELVLSLSEQRGDNSDSLLKACTSWANILTSPSLVPSMNPMIAVQRDRPWYLEVHRISNVIMLT